MINTPIVFDIETTALPEAELTPFMPEFEAPGNFKDPEKIKSAIEAKKASWLEDAALDPMTGRVLCIGMLIGDQHILISEPATEALILQEFWTAVRIEDYDIHQLIGFNIAQFDLPYLVKRSWKLGVDVPMLGLRDGRYWKKDRVIDLREIWQLGDRQAAGSLDTISKHLEVGAKTGNGKDFAALWTTDRPVAEAYLRNDLDLTAAIARKFGVL
jgi:DNA polymerase elongation subunit (family B)